MTTVPSRITVLGSGTGVPSLTRNPCSLLMRTGGLNLLFDCGAGVMKRLLETGVSIDDIAYLFLSHFHPDHVGELPALLFALKYSSPRSPTPPLTIVAGRGVSDFYQRFKGVYGHWIDLPPDRLQVIELDTGAEARFATPAFTVISRPVEHRPESLAFRIIDSQEKTMVYSGDTDECANLAAIAAGADLLVCESAFPDDQKVPGHLTPSLAGRIASRAGVKRLMLTHFYPACDGVDIEKQCRSAYTGRIVLARDLMTLTL